MMKDRKTIFKYFIFYVFTIFSSILAVIIYLEYFPVSSKVITEEKTINETKLSETAIEDAIENVYDSVVTVESYKNNQNIGSGSGFIYKEDKDKGYILTNHHVINLADKIEVILTNNEVVEVKLLGSDEYTDIAVLSIDKSKVTKVANLGNSDNMNLGSTVITVGSPMGSDYSGSITRGIISGKDRMIESSSIIAKVIQTDAAINPGNSGGPLVNLAGEVIGITSMKLATEEIEGMGFAIPINDVKNYVTYLEKGEEIKRPSIGISVISVSDRYSLYRYGLSVDSSVTKGVVISDIVSSKSADKAGLKKGDIITKFDDNEITSISTLRYYLYQYKTGDTINVTYIRNGKTSRLYMKLIEK
ncbi:MAG: trypsin-like peptidase domain-containing protein [Bacilli bacterium]|nr:trypsin-like peptidase domain-containing protein [Bacilli bacterium]MBP3635141.1 trypsin-like peptidase domain-containing protein [Bacilli bacterium]